MKNFNELLREKRISRRFTLSEVSKNTGVSIGYLSDLEFARKPVPSLEIVEKIANFLGDNGELVNSASQQRKLLPQQISKMLERSPTLSALFLRASEMSEEQLEKQLDALKKGDNGSESN